jgi:hypothetical protein
MRRKLPYAHQQALAFVGACCMFGAMVGALWSPQREADCDE